MHTRFTIRPSIHHVRAAVSLVVVILLAAVSTPFAAAAPPTAASSIMFVVDTSGSMSGSPLAQAKEALHAGIDALADNQAAGLRSFEGDCSNSGKLLVPVGTDNRNELDTATDNLYPGGTTPTPQALRAAANDLPATGDRTIVLISDGQSTCGDPCIIAQELKDRFGIDFRIHAVGFNAPDAAETELSCIARTTGGTYISATDKEGLTKAVTSLVESSQNSDLRPGIVCTSPTFIGVRGSGEEPQSRDIAYYQQAGVTRKAYEPDAPDSAIGPGLAAMFNHLQRQPNVDYDFNFVPVAYPATPVKALNAEYHKKDYRESVAIGEANLRRILTALQDKCGTSSKVVLAGYSQGANVVNSFLTQAQNRSAQELGLVKSVVFFGDPNRDSGHTDVREDATAGFGRGIVELGPTEGKVDVSPYARAHKGTVTSFCLSSDVVCDPLKAIADAIIQLARGGVAGAILGAASALQSRAIHLSYGSAQTKITCPITATKSTVLYECAAYRIMNDLGLTVPKTSPSPTFVQRAQKVLISVGGWAKNTPGTTLFASTPRQIGTFTTDKDGRAIVEVSIPGDAELGEHHLIVRQGSRSVEVPLTVADSAPPGTPVFSFGPRDFRDANKPSNSSSDNSSAGSGSVGNGSVSGGLGSLFDSFGSTGS